jgi:hypothetical protein
MTRDMPLFSRTPSAICMPAGLIPYARSGLLAEFGSATDALDSAQALDEVNLERWHKGLAQLDCARDLLNVVGLSASSADLDLNLALTTPRSARMLLDALRAIYDVEVQRLADAATDHVHLSLREIPILRNFIAEVERQLGRTTKRLQPILDAREKRTPQPVRFRP